MTESGNGKMAKVIMGVLIALILAAYGLIVADTRDDIQENKVMISHNTERKVDKQQYYRDIEDIKFSLNEIKRKLNIMP